MKEFCVDLEIAEELEKNNFPQTIYGWYKPNYDGRDRKPELLEVLARGTSKSSFNNLTYYRLTYAPTSDEILKELPVEINGFNFRIERTDTDFVIAYLELGYEDEVRFGYFHDKKLVNALAKMWLYLKKEGLLNENMGRSSNRINKG